MNSATHDARSRLSKRRILFLAFVALITVLSCISGIAWWILIEEAVPESALAEGKGVRHVFVAAEADALTHLHSVTNEKGAEAVVRDIFESHGASNIMTNIDSGKIALSSEHMSLLSSRQRVVVTWRTTFRLRADGQWECDKSSYDVRTE
jgi:hypothetical protein